MSEQNKQVRVGVAVFVWRGDKFLMGKRLGKHGQNTWSVPGGHLEYGETLAECAIRETLEEANLNIKDIEFLAITEDFFQESGKHYVTIWVNAAWKSGEPTVTEPDKWVEHSWKDFGSLPSPLFEPCFTNLRKVKPELFTRS